MCNRKPWVGVKSLATCTSKISLPYCRDEILGDCLAWGCSCEMFSCSVVYAIRAGQPKAPSFEIEKVAAPACERKAAAEGCPSLLLPPAGLFGCRETGRVLTKKRLPGSGQISAKNGSGRRPAKWKPTRAKTQQAAVLVQSCRPWHRLRCGTCQPSACSLCRITRLSHPTAFAIKLSVSKK